MSLQACASAICRRQLPFSEERARAWAAKVEAHVGIDPAGRGPRYWALFLGLTGANLDRVLIELGEPPAPRGRVPVMKVRRAFWLKRLFPALLLLLALPACWHTPPNPHPTPTPGPTPTPTPTPTPAVPPKGTPVAPEMLLRARPGTTGLQTNTLPDVPPVPVELAQYTPCCEDFAPEGSMRAMRVVPKPAPFRVRGVSQPTLWPLVSLEFMAYTMKHGAANAFHRRFGPFLVSEEPEWAAIGGPRDQAFWDTNREIAWKGLGQRVWFEDVPLDSWGYKFSQNGGTYIDMTAEAIAAFGHTWHPEHEAHLRKYVEEMGCFGNTIVALDNEGMLVRNYDPEFYRTMFRRYRALEQEVGCGFVHMVGTSVRELFGEVDYTITHDRAPLLAPIADKFTINNEHNPEFEPEQEASYFAQAREQHLAWGLWRGGATQPKYDETMRRVKAVVAGAPTGCFAPLPEDPMWGGFTLGGPGTQTQAVKDAQAAVGSQCKEPIAHQNGDAALDVLAAELRRRGFCASRNVDSVTIQSGSDPKVWEEFHAVSPYDTGCWSNNPAHYPKGLWVYNGTPPPPLPPACGEPLPPTVMQWNVKEHIKGVNRTVVDSTPLVGPASYCAAIGFTDGRSRCPVRMEGAPDRVACEAVAVGVPVWTGPGQQSPENPYQYIVAPRGVTGTAKVCASSAPAVCGSVEITP